MSTTDPTPEETDFAADDQLKESLATIRTRDNDLRELAAAKGGPEFVANIEILIDLAHGRPPNIPQRGGDDA